MDLADLKKATPGLNDKSHAEKIKLFAWYLHVHKYKSHFQPGEIKECYDALHYTPPQSFGGYLDNLKNSKEVLKNSSGYRLSAHVRDALDAIYAPTSGNKVQVTQLLRNLPGLIPDFAERTYLDEALICYVNSAFRASVVMAWNLAYHHLCDHIIKARLHEFNARWVVSYPGHHKKSNKVIATIDDFNAELKESEVLLICRDASIITRDIWKIMDEKLGKRNSAAHPSSVVIGQLQVDAFIDDLVKNVVLKIH